MRVGVISDTHGLLRPEACEALAGAFHIIHARDIGGPAILARLAEIAPLTAIRGNVDRGDWAADIPDTATVDLGGLSFHILHNRNDLAADPVEREWAVVIAGHSHKPELRREDGVLHINPGSAGRRRFRLPVTLAHLDLSADDFAPQIVTLVPDLTRSRG